MLGLGLGEGGAAHEVEVDQVRFRLGRFGLDVGEAVDDLLFEGFFP